MIYFFWNKNSLSVNDAMMFFVDKAKVRFGLSREEACRAFDLAVANDDQHYVPMLQSLGLEWLTVIERGNR